MSDQRCRSTSVTQIPGSQFGPLIFDVTWSWSALLCLIAAAALSTSQLTLLECWLPFYIPGRVALCLPLICRTLWVWRPSTTKLSVTFLVVLSSLATGCSIIVCASVALAFVIRGITVLAPWCTVARTGISESLHTSFNSMSWLPSPALFLLVAALLVVGATRVPFSCFLPRARHVCVYGKNVRLPVMGEGNVQLTLLTETNNRQTFRLRGVLYVPDGRENVLSTTLLAKSGWRITQDETGVRLRSQDNCTFKAQQEGLAHWLVSTVQCTYN